MSKNVTIIPPSQSKPDTLRVAAYCRVSSDSSDQLHSYASQIRKYTEEIGHHDGWELVDIYADDSAILGPSQKVLIKEAFI
ncbi:recombinase family protein [Flintibacter muris]|uniref:recombinase family protein n=1 Tax=Flintibacter muris TaxID=2941327 RepID=UPI00203E4456|nr:recombinase family protein [Flintibacter muris]